MSQQEREAAEWFVRVHADEVTTDELAEWQRWLAHAPDNRRAFQSIEDLWHDAADVRRPAWPLPSEMHHDRYRGSVPLTQWFANPHPATGGRSRWLRPLAIAATLAVVAVGLILFQREQSGAGTTLTTARAEVRTLTLEDGTRLTLGAQSTARVGFSSVERHIDMGNGDAYFDVAKDPRRPFTVSVGNKAIRALGTQFEVRKGQDIRIAVVEGKIAVTEQGAAQTQRPEVILSAGQQVMAHVNNPFKSPEPLQSKEPAAWRTGRLVYSNAPLREVVDDVARYSNRKIVLADADSDDVRYTGTVLPDDLEDWLASIRTTFPIDTRRDGDDTIQLRTRRENDDTIQ